MRVTQNTNYETIRGSIRRSRERMEGLQNQTATLKRLNTPSDDPVGAAKVLEIRTEKVNNDQFQNNVKLAETFLNNTDHALAEISDLVLRAKEIALGQSNGASSNDSTRLGVAEEVAQLFHQAIAAANRRIGERYLFGGYRTDKPPIDSSGRYLGDDGEMMTEITKDVFIAMNVTGLEAFNTQPSSSVDKGRFMHTRSPASEGNAEDSIQATSENVNAFDEIQNLRIALLSGDIDAVRNTLDRLDQIHSKLVSVRSKVGSRMQGVHSMSQALERQDVTNSQLSSVLEDADMAQVMSDLAKEETVFRSSLSSAQKLIQPTLLDFLK